MGRMVGKTFMRTCTLHIVATHNLHTAGWHSKHMVFLMQWQPIVRQVTGEGAFPARRCIDANRATREGRKFDLIGSYHQDMTSRASGDHHTTTSDSADIGLLPDVLFNHPSCQQWQTTPLGRYGASDTSGDLVMPQLVGGEIA